MENRKQIIASKKYVSDIKNQANSLKPNLMDSLSMLYNITPYIKRKPLALPHLWTEKEMTIFLIKIAERTENKELYNRIIKLIKNADNIKYEDSLDDSICEKYWNGESYKYKFYLHNELEDAINIFSVLASDYINEQFNENGYKNPLDKLDESYTKEFALRAIRSRNNSDIHSDMLERRLRYDFTHDVWDIHIIKLLSEQKLLNKLGKLNSILRDEGYPEVVTTNDIERILSEDINDKINNIISYQLGIELASLTYRDSFLGFKEFKEIHTTDKDDMSKIIKHSNVL